MIVIAMVALLATIAIPAHLRARSRAQASAIINDAKQLDGAIAAYAIENNASSDSAVSFPLLSPYLKTANHLVTTNGEDILGNPFLYTTVRNGVQVNPATKASFDPDVVPATYWGSY